MDHQGLRREVPDGYFEAVVFRIYNILAYRLCRAYHLHLEKVVGSCSRVGKQIEDTGSRRSAGVKGYQAR